MKKNKWLACLVALALFFAANAMAAEHIDAKKDVCLTVEFRDNGEGLSNAEFSIYHVASFDAAGQVTMAAPFDKYNVILDGKSESEMAGAAVALEGYVLRDQIAPAHRGTTNHAGMAVFSGSQLKQGLYLVTGSRYIANGMVYTVQPAIVQLPTWDAAGERWVYDVTINAKYETQPDSPGGNTITRKVLKVWNNDGGATSIPEEAVIHLLQDGQVFDTVKLNAENSWRHTWSELDENHHWAVVEEALDEYSVSITREGITFVVTNTYDPPDIPSDPDESDPTPPPDKPSDPGKLPQTGQLWWPVAMLVAVGLMLIVIGLARRRGN